MKQFFLIITLFSFTILSFGQLNMELLGHLPYSQSLSDVWGYVDEEGNEYALVGTYNGLSVVDVTDPANPTEIFFGSGPNSIWRDLKTWGDYAYVSNESGEGIYIVDLSPLPNDPIVSTTNFTGSSYNFSSVHNIYIDEMGKLYIFGANNGVGGAIICDLTIDPMNPVELGRFNDFYLHDGMARGDTLWGGAIYAGLLLAIDVSNPANPNIMGTASTPSQFTHNAWVSDDGTHVFTTDEVSNGYIGAFDVTDLSNIIETDRIQSNPGSGVIPHNAHVLNDFIITSYYSDGVTIHDASNPKNLIEVANFDTSPNYSGNGYNGSWGAYPYLPSGNILASDIEEGLKIMSVNYVRASFIEGIVSDSLTGDPLFDVTVEISDSYYSTQTAFDGSYEFGILLSGTYDIYFHKEGYNYKTISGVEIVAGQVVALNVDLGMSVSVGLAENNLVERFELYPNPFTSEITIEYQLINDTETQLRAEIYNAVGLQIEEISLEGIQNKLKIGENLPAGVYFVKLTNGQQFSNTKRIIKL